MKRNVTIVTGAFWGDEGKGRAAHVLSEGASLSIRSTGGNNAGHTVVANGQKYVLHLLPASVIRPELISIIATGVVCDIDVLAEEIKTLQSMGIEVSPDNLKISNRAHVILPHHRMLDALYETLKKKIIGTTGRGIGPCYEEICRRTSIQLGDIVGPRSSLCKKLEEGLQVYNVLAEKFGTERVKIQEEMIYCCRNAEMLKPYITDVQIPINKAIEHGEKIILEGAQALRLDLYHGDYPYVTSSSPNASGTASGAGIGPTYIERVIGVTKAYCSRVGEGPFPTEEDNETGDKIRELGHEYGSTTGRPRRCGWLDLVALKAGITINGYTELCLNHLDTIGKLDEIKVCVSYRQHDGRRMLGFSYVPTIPVNLENVEPIYEAFQGNWDAEGITDFEELPEKAKAFVNFIEAYTRIPVTIIGTGPDERDTIIR